jgi:hypothetical protein
MTEGVWNFVEGSESKVMAKLIHRGDCIPLGSFANPSTGITTGLDEILVLDEATIRGSNLESGAFIKVLRGRNIDPWLIRGPYDYAFYPYRLRGDETELIPEKELKETYPSTYAYVLQHRKELLERKDSRRTVAENKEWFGLIRKGKLSLFNRSKIVTPALTKHNSFAIDEASSAYVTGGAGVFALVQERFDNRFLLGILNSKLIEYFLHAIATKKQNGFFSYLNTFLSQIPIIDVDRSKQREVAERVELLTRSVEEVEESKRRFLNRLRGSFPDIVVSQKIGRFYELDFVEFMREVSLRSHKQLSLRETDEWEEYFDDHRRKVERAIAQVQKATNGVDEMVFGLYGLDSEEIRTVRERTAEQ